MSGMATAKLVHKPGESIRTWMDFTGQLADDEVLTGTPTVTLYSGSGLTLSSPTVNTAVIERHGLPDIAIGKAVLYRREDGVDGTTYVVDVLCSTDLMNVRGGRQEIICSHVA